MRLDNMLTMEQWLLIYPAGGLILGPLFVFLLVNFIDIHARSGSLGFRLMILPASILLWPLTLVFFFIRLFLGLRSARLAAQPPVVKKRKAATRSAEEKPTRAARAQTSPREPTAPTQSAQEEARIPSKGPSETSGPGQDQANP